MWLVPRDTRGLTLRSPVPDVVREALVRWFDPPRGWVPPSEFVPVAEEAELIDRVGQFVLGRACEEAAGWADDARVAVNVSAAQLGRGTLLPAVRRALQAASLPAHRLEIEITETALLLHGDCVLAREHRQRLN